MVLIFRFLLCVLWRAAFPLSGRAGRHAQRRISSRRARSAAARDTQVWFDICAAMVIKTFIPVVFEMKRVEIYTISDRWAGYSRKFAADPIAKNIEKRRTPSTMNSHGTRFDHRSFGRNWIGTCGGLSGAG